MTGFGRGHLVDARGARLRPDRLQPSKVHRFDESHLLDAMEAPTARVRSRSIGIAARAALLG